MSSRDYLEEDVMDAEGGEGFLPVEETALVAQHSAPLAMTAAAIARLENGAAIFERFEAAMERVRRAAIRATCPQDWVLSRASGDSEDATMATLCATGFGAIAQLFGLSPVVDPQTGAHLPMFGPVDASGAWAPRRFEGKQPGVYGYEGWARASCPFNGRSEMVVAARRCDEQFAGRTVNDDGRIVSKGEAALDSDLKSALLSLLKRKLISALTGIGKVPAEELTAAWPGFKSIAKCRKGHGYGTSTERSAQRVADEGVGAAAGELAKEILTTVNGDRGAAQQILMEITSNKEKGFEGHRSAAKFTQMWQVEGAKRRWSAHPMNGGKAAETSAGAAEG